MPILTTENTLLHLREEMKRDKAKHKILPPSKFGLIQITRQRVRPEKTNRHQRRKPDKDGEILAPIFVVERMEETIKDFFTKTRADFIPTHASVCRSISYQRIHEPTNEMVYQVQKMGNHYPKRFF